MTTINGAVRGFAGQYRWLRNFWPCQIRAKNGDAFSTAEHAFQAAKCWGHDPDAWHAIRLAETPGEAKRLGRRVKLPADWDAKKVPVMLAVLRQKFTAGTELAAKLLATGDAELVEENAWGDQFWGVCRGEGENRLGRLLMQVRDELRAT